MPDKTNCLISKGFKSYILGTCIVVWNVHFTAGVRKFMVLFMHVHVPMHDMLISLPVQWITSLERPLPPEGFSCSIMHQFWMQGPIFMNISMWMYLSAKTTCLELRDHTCTCTFMADVAVFHGILFYFNANVPAIALRPCRQNKHKTVPPPS